VLDKEFQSELIMTFFLLNGFYKSCVYFTTIRHMKISEKNKLCEYKIFVNNLNNVIVHYADKITRNLLKI